MTKAQIKLFQALSRQKYRKEHNAYLVEGDKNAREWLMSAAHIIAIAATADWLENHRSLCGQHREADIMPAETFELEKITNLHTAPPVILMVRMPDTRMPSSMDGEWALYLDRIQDPGNMGTIIRTADWFGIKQLFLSPDCAEVYNPKVVQASMGSLLRVSVCSSSMAALQQQFELPLYAACLGGADLNTLADPQPGLIAVGNESQGLSDEVLRAASHKITIPAGGGAESLNVAVATGIICFALTGRKA
jgi:TrmH family RNA methyltransferase